MNRKRIQEIEKRLLTTTPGVWRVFTADKDYFGDDSPTIVTEQGQYIAQTDYDSLHSRGTAFADAEFIAHAKEDMEFLLTQLKIIFEEQRPFNSV